MLIRTYVLLPGECERWILVETGTDNRATLYGPKLVTDVYEADCNRPKIPLQSYPIPMHNGKHYTEQEAMLVHMSTVAHILRTPEYYNLDKEGT